MIEGTWPENDVRRAFVSGAKWWEYHSTGGTMWQSDQRLAEAEAEKRYGACKLNREVCKRCCKKFLRKMTIATIPPPNRCKYLHWMMTEFFEKCWAQGNSPCPINVEPNLVGHVGITLITDPPPEWCPFAEEHKCEMEAPQIKKGDRVYHTDGGRGEVRDLQNDWSTTPPTVVAVVRVVDTMFHDIRRIPVSDLRLERRKS